VATKRTKKTAPALDDYDRWSPWRPSEEVVAEWATAFERWMTREGGADVKNAHAGLVQEFGGIPIPNRRSNDFGANYISGRMLGLIDNVKYMAVLHDALSVHQLAEKLLRLFAPDAHAWLQSALDARGFKYPPPTDDDNNLDAQPMEEVLRDILRDASFLGRFALKPDYVMKAMLADARAKKKEPRTNQKQLDVTIEKMLPGILKTHRPSGSKDKGLRHATRKLYPPALSEIVVVSGGRGEG
jgi:hypothetical protein